MADPAGDSSKQARRDAHGTEHAPRHIPRHASEVGELIDRPTRRRAGVFRRAIRREISRLHDRWRIAAIVILVVVLGVFTAGLIARGEAAGADARAYWAAVRIWLNGGDPYHPTGPFLPYVYAPWMLPLFAPWALLPWDIAWFVWRGTAMLLLLWTGHWAYRQRPLPTAFVVLLLSFPIAANLDTGNITLFLTLALWAAQFVGPRMAGLLWGLATWMKWLPALLWFVLAPRARAWGLLWLGLSAILSLATLPLTLVQLEAVFDFGGRPIRVDYLVLLWATVPWLWRHPHPLWWLTPAEWPRVAESLRTEASAWATRFRTDPDRAAQSAGRAVRQRLRAFLGLRAG